MSGSSNSDDHSIWTPTGYCDCSAIWYEIEEIEWTTHSMGEAGRVAWNVFRTVAAVSTIGLSTVVNGGLKSYTHEAVWLLVHCRKCGCDMNLTCELGKSDKMMRWGHYGYYITRREYKKVEKRLSYKEIKKIFDKMWRSYNLVNGNCSHWAGDFYGRVWHSSLTDDEYLAWLKECREK
uniref:Uncharacterized protein n=1 Tax=Meloidogyne floridensis TaxID=298350 RepID=A0A915P8D6_9BILA